MGPTIGIVIFIIDRSSKNNVEPAVAKAAGLSFLPLPAAFIKAVTASADRANCNPFQIR